MKTYYKVVLKGAGERLLSIGNAFCVRHNNPTVLEYRIGRRTVPEFGGILVFNELDTALRFVAINRLNGRVPYAILAGKGKKRRLCKWRCCTLFSPDTVDNFKKTWKPGRKKWSHMNTWPVGTVALEWFEPESVVVR